MATSLYYQVKRDRPISDDEWGEIERIVNRYTDDQEIRNLTLNGGGELFSISRPASKGQILLQGATELPGRLFREDVFDFMTVVEAWFHLLSDLRNLIPDAIWEVRLDDQPLYWNPTSLEYERPK
jgi:hypothetical protein